MGRWLCSLKGLLGSPALWLPVWLSHLALISPAMRVRPCRAELVLTSSRPWLSQMGSYMNSPILTKLACPLHHKDENGLKWKPTRAAHVTLFRPRIGVDSIHGLNHVALPCPLFSPLPGNSHFSWPFKVHAPPRHRYHVPVIPAPKRLRLEECKFKASMYFIASSRPAQVTQWKKKSASN